MAESEARKRLRLVGERIEAAIRGLRTPSEYPASVIRDDLRDEWAFPWEPVRHALRAWAFALTDEIGAAGIELSNAVAGGFHSPVVARMIVQSLGATSPSDISRFDVDLVKALAESADEDPLATAWTAMDAGTATPVWIASRLRRSPLSDGSVEVDPVELWEWMRAGQNEHDSELARAQKEAHDLADEARTSLDTAINDIAERQDQADTALGRLSTTIQQAATGNLIKAYASRAEKANRRANLWTAATVVVTVIAVTLACVLLLIEPDNLTTGEAVARVGLTLSVLTLAGFSGRMASHERRDVRSWTHMDLQLSTAQGFIQDLPDGLRSEAQLALALRFFPGQAQDPHGDAGSSSEAFDVPELLRLARTAGGTKPTPQG